MKRAPKEDIALVEDIGRRLKAARELRKLGVNELGRYAGLKGGVVSRIESGAHPALTYNTIYRVVNALKVRWEWLNTGRGEMFVDEPWVVPSEPSGTTVGESGLPKVYESTPDVEESSVKRLPKGNDS